jgi:hypothetical protein
MADGLTPVRRAGQLAVNWFEGGRRISKLFMGMVTLGGAAYVAFADTPIATLESEPGQPWRVAQTKCDFGDLEEYSYNLDWGGDRRGVSFCFRALDNGGIPYAIAPTPADEANRYAAEQSKEEAEDRAREARGEPPPLRRTITPPQWYYTATEYSDTVRNYAKKRVAEFKMTPELQQRLQARQKAVWWEARSQAAGEAFQFVLAICAFIWVFTAVTAWIIRGFAGVPRGQDFKLGTTGRE